MLAKSFLIFVASLLSLACSGAKKDVAAAGAAGYVGVGGGAGGGGGGGSGSGGEAASAALVEPAGLGVTALPGGNGVFNVIALTLRRGPTNAELYAAVRNDGKTLACSPAFSVELFDKSEQSLIVKIGGLLVRRFYRFTDGSDTTAACVAPGDVSMVAIADLPSDIVIEEVGRITYWCNYWVFDLEPIEGISITDVQAVTRTEGVAYTGTLVNGFDVPLSSPSVAVFPVNRGGRPLGVALGHGTAEIPPGGRWDFETSSVSDPGVDQAAYPTGGS